VFKSHQAPDEVAEFTLPASDSIWIPALLKEAGMVTSNSEGRRMLGQGAVKLDGARVEAEELARTELVGGVLQVGKRRFVRLLG
jgi:tyrosyl-tRNA synthetase